MGTDGDSGGLKRESVSGLLWLLSGTGVQAIVQIAVVAILARLIAPKAFGLLATSKVVANMGLNIGVSGIGRAVIQKQDLSDKYVRTAFTASTLIGLVISAVLFAGADFIAELFSLPDIEPVIRGLALYVVIQAMVSVSTGLLERRLQFARLKSFQVVGYIVGYGGVGVYLAHRQLGVWALVAAVLVQAAVTGILQYMSIRHSVIPTVDRQSVKELAHYAGGMSLTGMFNFAALRADYLVVARWLGDTAVGLYERAYRLMEGGLKAGAALDQVLFPAMSRLQDAPETLARVYRRSVAAMALLFLPGSVFLFVTAPEIVRLALGGEWSRAIPVFRLFAFGVFLRSGYKLAAGVARAKGFVYELSLRQGVYAILVVGGAIIGAQAGIEEVALAILIVLVIHYLSMAAMGVRHTQVSWMEFAGAHYHGLVVSGLVLVISGLVAISLRRVGPPDYVVLSAVIVANLGVLLVLINWTPKKVLGVDGIWLLETLDDRFPLGGLVRWL